MGILLTDHLCELSNIFLHGRKLLRMSNRVNPKSNLIYINKALFIGKPFIVLISDFVAC